MVYPVASTRLKKDASEDIRSMFQASVDIKQLKTAAKNGAASFLCVGLGLLIMVACWSGTCTRDGKVLCI